MLYALTGGVFIGNALSERQLGKQSHWTAWNQCLTRAYSQQFPARNEVTNQMALHHRRNINHIPALITLALNPARLVDCLGTMS
jgi:hypothetical protein